MSTPAPPLSLAAGAAGAPVHRLSQAQRDALRVLFFAGELRRLRGRWCAPGFAAFEGRTVESLLEAALVKLRVASGPQRGPAGYHVSVALTRRGHWYAATLAAERAALQANLDALAEAGR